VFAVYGLVVIQVRSWGMTPLPRRVWHGVHFSSLVFVAATVHGALSGADRASPLVQAVAVSGVTVVVGLTVLRVLRVLGSKGDVASSRSTTRQAIPSEDPDVPEGSVVATTGLRPPTAAERLPDPDPATASPSEPAILG
jgi:hypothetical protein